MSLLVEKIGLFFKVAGWSAVKITPAILVSVFYKFPVGFLKFAAIQGWDLGLFLGNILTPQRKKGSVVKAGHPGHGGVWPEFVAPTKGDSRSPCPYLSEYFFFLRYLTRLTQAHPTFYLDAMANHGILPHDGKNIKLTDLGEAMVNSFNFSPSLVKDTIGTVAKQYDSDTIDLG